MALQASCSTFTKWQHPCWAKECVAVKGWQHMGRWSYLLSCVGSLVQTLNIPIKMVKYWGLDLQLILLSYIFRFWDNLRKSRHPKWWRFMDFSSYSLFKQIEETWQFLEPTYVRKFDETEGNLWRPYIGHNSPPARCSNPKKQTQQHPPFLSCTYRSRVTTDKPTNPNFFGKWWPARTQVAECRNLSKFPPSKESSWWFQSTHLKKICSRQIASFSPGFGVKMEKCVERTQLVIDFMA